MKKVISGLLIFFSTTAFAGVWTYEAANLSAQCSGDNFIASLTVSDLRTGITLFEKEWNGYLMAAITQPFEKCLKLQKQLDDAKQTNDLVIIDGNRIEIKTRIRK